MYDNIRIIKIIKSNGVQLEVDWNLDLQNRKISRSQIDYTLFLKLFDLKKSFKIAILKNKIYYCFQKLENIIIATIAFLDFQLICLT